MLPLLTSRQWEELQAYYRLEPFGHRIDHQMMAQIALLLAAAHGGDTAWDNYMPGIKQTTENEGDPLDSMFPGVSEFAATVAAEAKAAKETKGKT